MPVCGVSHLVPIYHPSHTGSYVMLFLLLSDQFGASVAFGVGYVYLIAEKSTAWPPRPMRTNAVPHLIEASFWVRSIW